MICRVLVTSLSIITIWLCGCFGPTPMEPLVLRGVHPTRIESPDGLEIECRLYSDSPPSISIWVSTRDSSAITTWTLIQHTGHPGGVGEPTAFLTYWWQEIALQKPDATVPREGRRFAKTLLEFRRVGSPRPAVVRYLVSWARFDVMDDPPGPPIRSWWMATTYPAWGLWRDILDAPVTFLRRGGFDENHGLKNAAETPVMVGLFLILGGCTIGAPVAAAVLISPWWVAVPAAIVALPIGALTGFTLGVWYTLATGPLFRLLVDPPQNHLLRGGVDSKDYFPNWRFGVFDRTRAPIKRMPSVTGDTHWVVTEIRRIP
ncbi:hypothetical protein KQI84_09800 [bacterium]|nr:hypothetical protein [bacterium]